VSFFSLSLFAKEYVFDHVLCYVVLKPNQAAEIVRLYPWNPFGDASGRTLIDIKTGDFEGQNIRIFVLIGMDRSLKRIERMDLDFSEVSEDGESFKWRGSATSQQFYAPLPPDHMMRVDVFDYTLEKFRGYQLSCRAGYRLEQEAI